MADKTVGNPTDPATLTVYFSPADKAKMALISEFLEQLQKLEYSQEPSNPQSDKRPD